MPGGCRPQPTLLRLAISTRLSNRAAPAIKRPRLNHRANRCAGLGLELRKRGGDQSADGPVVDDQQPVVVQPLSGTNEQLFTVSASAYLVPQFSHQGAAPMLAHPSESKGLAGNLLVVEQGAAAAIHRAQRCEFRGVDAELAAEVAP
ncbi:hypothetical protein OKW43_000124 [Paraburkholderia sp. WC7.3g]